MRPDDWLAWFPVFMRYGALVGVAYETIFEKFDRPALLALFAAMLGISEVTAVIRESKKKNGNGNGNGKDPEAKK